MININTNRKIRAQFIRKDDLYIIERIPNGVYTLKIYNGNKWDYELLMTNDKAKGGFKNNSNFSILDDVKNGYISIISAEREYGILINDDDTYEEKEERLEYRKKVHNN